MNHDSSGNRLPVDDDLDQLASLLSEFARTLLTEFSIQEILNHLVLRIVEALPVSGAGVSLITPGRPPRYVAASDDSALDYERLQTKLGEGPCMEAFETGVVVASADLESETRFPAFTSAALALGLRAVFSAPMQHSSGRLGALDLYRDTPGELSERDLVSAQTLADVVTAYVLNAEAREEARTSADLFRQNALHDPLTGLPNRLLMMQRMTHAGQRAQRSHAIAAVLFADLDDFKLVNDLHGHAVGDQLLVAVGSRLLALVRPGDTLARLSGDEFLFLCEDLSSEQDVDELVRRIDQSFAVPFSLPDQVIRVSASVGVAFSGPGEAITNSLISDADSAMYAAKRLRKGIESDSPFDSRGRRGINLMEDLAEDLGRALRERAIELAYQPIVRTADGVVVGAEALLRWTHPVRGPIPAPQTVALAEHTRLIDELGAWTIRRGCQDRANWTRHDSPGLLDLTMNVSAVQLLNPALLRAVEQTLSELEVDPSTLVLELTESTLIRDGGRALVVMRELKRMGVRLALDDFGTGYSSLSHLHRFPIDIVKIDRSFVERITFDHQAAVIVAAVTDLAHELNMRVIAEGAETGRQADMLREMGCEGSQGYFYARPMSAADLGSLLDVTPGPATLPAS